MYTIIYEYGHKDPSPRYFEPSASFLSYADNLAEARSNIKRVIGKNRLADLFTKDPLLVERRRNRTAIATIYDHGQR